MKNSTDSMSTVLERLNRLERNNRRLTTASCLMGALILLLLSIGAAANQAGSDGVTELLQVNVLEVLDDDGRVRARLDVDNEEGPGLALFDGNSTLRQRFFIAYDHIPRLSFYDAEGNLRELMGVSSDGAAVKLFDTSATMRAIMGLYIDGSTGIVLLDENANVRAGFGLNKDGEPGFELFDAFGESIFLAP